MAATITPINFTLPDRSQTETVFDANVKLFMAYIKTLGPEINQAISELLVGADVEVYSGAATYNAPTIVAGSDGMRYACVGTGVTGDDPVGSVSGNWVRLTLKTSDAQLYPLASGVKAEGGIIGLRCSRTGDHEVTFSAGNCFDGDNGEMLTLGASQAVSSLPITASAWFHFFLCDDGVVRYDTDVTGATLLAAYTTKRRIFSAPNTSGGVLAKFRHYGNIIEFDITDSITLATNPSTTAFTPTYTGVIPTTIVNRVGLWGKYTSAAFGFSLSDGTSLSRKVSIGTATYKSSTDSGDFLWVTQDQKIAGESGSNTGVVVIAAVEFIR